VYNISFANLKSFSLWPTFPSPMLLASPAVPKTQETRENFCIHFVNQYAQILIYCKSSSHAHQLWYQAQTILTWDFIVVTAYNRLPLTHSLRAYAVQQQLIKHFSI